MFHVKHSRKCGEQVFFYDVNMRGSLSLYEYLYRCIRHDIAHGAIAPGEKLPSKRALAKHLGVSRITVEAAYEQLAAEGYIRSRERCGYYACDLAPAARIDDEAGGSSTDASRSNKDGSTKASSATSESANATACNNKNSSHTQQEAPVASKAPSIPTASRKQPIADFTHSTLATRMFPYNTWSKVVRRTLSDESAASLAQAASAAGSLQLRQAIAAHLHEFRGMGVSAEQIVIGAGSQTLYQLVVQLLGRTRTFAVEDPGYPLLTHMYQQQNVAIEHAPLDKGGISITALEATNASVAHIMPSHQFPTGIVTTAARRRELLNWAREGDRYLIEDDYDSEFRMAGRPIPPLFSIDAADRVLYLNSFAKSLGAAFRIAYLVLPPHLAAQFHTQLGFYANTVSPLDQLALAHFIEGGHYERHVNRMRTHARKTQDALVNALSAAFGSSSIAFANLNNGLHFVMELQSEQGERELAAAAATAGIRIAPLSSFNEPAQIGATPNASKDPSPARFVLRSDSISTEEAPAIAATLAQAWK